MPKNAPRILILGRQNYIGIARLPKALHEAGAHVSALCRPGDFLSATRFLSSSHYWGRSRPLGLLKLFWVTLRDKPDLIIAADESATKALATFNRIWPHKASRLALPPTREALQAATLRAPNQLLAQKLGIRCPAAQEINSSESLQAFITRAGLPLVLKADHTAAGVGVRICHTEDEAQKAWAEMKVPSLLAQRYITGRPAMCAVSMIKGKVLSSLCTDKTQVHPPGIGPSSVVKFIEHDAMVEAARLMAGALQASGFMSVDFMVEADGTPWLIECNLRPTPVCHLGTLAFELVRALGGQGRAGRQSRSPPTPNWRSTRRKPSASLAPRPP